MKHHLKITSSKNPLTSFKSAQSAPPSPPTLLCVNENITKNTTLQVHKTATRKYDQTYQISMDLTKGCGWMLPLCDWKRSGERSQTRDSHDRADLPPRLPDLICSTRDLWKQKDLGKSGESAKVHGLCHWRDSPTIPA